MIPLALRAPYAARSLPLALAALVLLSTSPAAAQRRSPAEAWTPPVELALVPWPGDAAAPRPFRYVVALRASSEVEVIADARLVRVEITVPGRRRPHRCEMPGRPRRADESRARTLRAGERWAEWIDLRELCWGRALAALTEPGATASVTYEVGRGAHAWVARAGAERGAPSARSLTAEGFVLPRAVAGAAAAAARAADAAARITLDASDARSGSPTFRVRVYAAGSARRRAWLRPDRFRFRVVDPEGASWECALPTTGGSPIPDLFSRLDARRGASFSLDGAAYCGRDVFGTPGVYEVTPIVVLDEDGSAWDLDAIVGTFEGAPVPVRVRGPRGDRTVPADVLGRILR